MARSPRPEHKPIYDVAAIFVDRALRSDDSLFTPGTAIWTSVTLDDLKARFVDRPDETSNAFTDKLRGQLDGAPPETVQLMAEVIFVYFLPARSVHGDTKRALIDEVLSWMPEPAALPDALQPALDTGIAAMGTAFNTYRPFLLHFLIAFARAWKQSSREDRDRMLRDPWAFKEFTFALPLHAAQTQREALLHVVHPETFEPIVSRDAKRTIAERFAHLVNPTVKDVDRQIVEVREKLAEEHGDFSFYQRGIKELWQPDTSPWGRFIVWARRFHEHPAFDATERDYKLEAAAEMARVRDAVVAEGQWASALRRALTSTNLTSWRTHRAFLDWCDADVDLARSALRTLWMGEGSLTDRIGSFAEAFNAAVPGLGSRLSIASLLAMGIDPTEHPPYRVTVFDKGYELTGHPKPAKGASAADTYRHAIEFLDRLSQEAAGRGLDLRDRLDAQSVLWAVLRNDLPDGATDKERRGLAKYRGDVVDIDDDGADTAVEPSTLDDVAADLLLDAAYLRRIERLLRDKGQVIFHGPPGTGKTFVARRLGAHLAGGEDGVEVVQLHPSYAYEDFVEGYRPAPPAEGKPGFVLRDGPLKDLARRAADAPERTFLLVIDEINRGNVAKVFGELYFLLEYRNAFIRLQYSDRKFTLPDNLWFIGTMNTADRSIALVDAALRRRFHFVPFFPDEAPINGLLARWLSKHRPELSWVADAVEHVNGELVDRNLAIGPSHFLRDDLDEEWVDLIWKHSVLPYLEEQLFGERDRIHAFELDAVRAKLRRDPAPGIGTNEMTRADDAAPAAE